ncbi:MAG: phospho-N-acetylmuramoyl-pentapeptide-transferase [Planctomycetaceae bacterium]
MLIWLLNQFAPLSRQMEIYASGDSRVFLTARTALASVTAFLIAILLGPMSIRWLKQRFPERVDSASDKLNELQSNKNATPTMGGLFVIGAVLVASLLWADLQNRYVQLGILVAVGFASIGAVDDWIKLSTSRNGLRVRQKLAAQVVVSCVVSAILYREQIGQMHGIDLVWPIGGWVWPLGVGFLAWCVLVLVASSNAVNLTDGLDGLASGCTIFAGSAFIALCYLSGHAVLSVYLSIPNIVGAGELGVVLAGLVGAILGFLWFNCYPAQVFMGDTGSLPIGGLLALAALVTRQEILLVVVGGVFVVEALSVICQVGWFRCTGERLIACSPLHNHYLFKGHHEIKIVVRFWIGSALLAIVAVASLKIR